MTNAITNFLYSNESEYIYDEFRISHQVLQPGQAKSDGGYKREFRIRGGLDARIRIST